MTQPSDDPHTFLRSFFGAGNSIQWFDYENAAPTDAMRVYLAPWVQRFVKNKNPFLLPRVDTSSKQTTWYVLCGNPREARSMRESLLAFIGPTYSKFNGELATLDPNDSIDDLCKSAFGSLVFRLPIVQNDDRARVGQLLNTLINYRDRESHLTLDTVKPIGRLLRDLEMALLVNNEKSAWAVYGEIRSRGRLSATNLAFLQIRILGAFEQWAELLMLPSLNDLLQVRRPKKISDQIARAVYHHHLAKYETPGDAAQAVDAYRGTSKRFQNLLRSTTGLQSSEAIKFALVSAVSADPPLRELANQLAGHAAIATDAAWAEALLATMPSAEPAEGVPNAATDLADVRYNENNFDEALTLYLKQDPTKRSIQRVLETAVEVDTRQSAEDALAYLSSAPEEIEAQVLGRRVFASYIEILSTILGRGSNSEPKPITSLLEWFESVDAGEPIDRASDVLGYGIQEWASSFSFDAFSIAQQLKKSRSGKPNEIVRNSVPVFIRELLTAQSPTRECKPIYNALTELLIYDEAVGEDDLAAVEQLSEAILTTAPCHETGNNDFEFVAEISVHLWETVAAPRHFEWVLSMLDLLIDTGAQQHTSLTPILASIAESSRLWARRISDDQWTLLELIAADLNLSEMVAGLRHESKETDEDGVVDIRGLLAGKSVAVYSLTERIARRFGQLAEKTFDGIKIHYIHDKSLTDRMKSLAKSTDIFIVNTWDAKHAATNGIKDSRPAGMITLEPASKSASGLLLTLKNSLSL